MRNRQRFSDGCRVVDPRHVPDVGNPHEIEALTERHHALSLNRSGIHPVPLANHEGRRHP